MSEINFKVVEIDNTENIFGDYRRKLIRNPALILAIIILIAALICIILVSYLQTDNNAFVSNLFLSLSTGIITGMTFYVMSNIKNQKILLGEFVENSCNSAIQSYEQVQFLILEYRNKNNIVECTEDDRKMYFLKILPMIQSFLDNGCAVLIQFGGLLNKEEKNLRYKQSDEIVRYKDLFKEYELDYYRNSNMPESTFISFIENCIEIQSFYVYIKSKYYNRKLDNLVNKISPF